MKKEITERLKQMNVNVTKYKRVHLAVTLLFVAIIIVKIIIITKLSSGIDVTKTIFESGNDIGFAFLVWCLSITSIVLIAAFHTYRIGKFENKESMTISEKELNTVANENNIPLELLNSFKKSKTNKDEKIEAMKKLDEINKEDVDFDTYSNKVRYIQIKPQYSEQPKERFKAADVIKLIETNEIIKDIKNQI